MMLRKPAAGAARLCLSILAVALFSSLPGTALAEKGWTPTGPPKLTEDKHNVGGNDEVVFGPESADLERLVPRDADSPAKPQPILAMVYVPDGRTVAIAREDRTITLLDGDTGRVRAVLTGHEDAVTCLACSCDGKVLASGGPDNLVKLWDVASGKELATLRGHTSWVYALAFSPDGKTLASAGYDKVVRLWGVAGRKEQGSLPGHMAAVRALAFSPDGATLTSAGSDRVVKLWNLKERTEQATFKGHGNTVKALAFSPDGKTLASGGQDTGVRLWNVATGVCRILEGHTDEVQTVAFSPSGRMLASGSADNSVKLWDPATGMVRTTLTGHTDAVMAVAFAPDGKRLISAGSEGGLKVWSAVAKSPPMPPADLAMIAKEVPTRQFALPLIIQRDERMKINQVRLFVSVDSGKTWKHEKDLKASDELILFTAPKDGYYWFALQVNYKDGRSVPADLDALTVAMKVLVNTEGTALKGQKTYEELQREVEELRKTVEQLQKRLKEAESDRKPR